MFLVAGGNHRAAGCRDYPRHAGFERVVDVWLQIVFVWLRRPAAADRISPFDVFTEPHGRAVHLLAGQT